MNRRRKPGRVIAGPADLAGDMLHLRPGIRTITIDAEGNETSDVFEARRTLLLNVGDAAIVASSDLTDDSIAVVEIVAMTAADTLRLTLLRGALPATGRCYVMPCERARPVKRPAKSRRPAERPGAFIAELARRVRLEGKSPAFADAGNSTEAGGGL